jgi:hypothetical protein
VIGTAGVLVLFLLQSYCNQYEQRQAVPEVHIQEDRGRGQDEGPPEAWTLRGPSWTGWLEPTIGGTPAIASACSYILP